MRHAVFAGALALLYSASAAAPAQAQAAQKFAFVNSQAILAAAPGAQEAQAQFQKEMEALRSQVTKLGDSLNTLQQAFQKEEVSLSPAVKETRLKALRDKSDDYQARVQKLNEQAEQRQNELMSPILESVRKVLDDVRTEGGYSFIFDVAAGSFIVSADKNLDITDRVVARMKLSAPKAAAKPASGPAASPTGLKKPPTQ
jgi:outer membrane protein